MKFRKGDRVLVEGTVLEMVGEKRALLGFAWASKGGGYAGDEIEVPLAGAKLLPSGPPQPGDIVIHEKDESLTYQVLAIHGKFAWVGRVGAVDRFITIHVDSLVVVDRA
jgi:hypothetical protein